MVCGCGVPVVFDPPPSPAMARQQLAMRLQPPAVRPLSRWCPPSALPAKHEERLHSNQQPQPAEQPTPRVGTRVGSTPRSSGQQHCQRSRKDLVRNWQGAT